MSNPLVQSSSCVHTLPFEVWRSIFANVVDQEPSLPKKMKTVLGLTHVCAAWRSIVYDASELWTHIQVRVDMKQKTYPSIDVLSLFLQNARERPLTMDLSVEKKECPFPIGETRQIFLFLRRIHRAKSLNLSFYGLDRLRRMEYAIYCLIGDEMKGAKDLAELTLELDFERSAGAESMRWLAPLWNQASSLRTLHLTGQRDPFSFMSVSIPQAFQTHGFPLSQLKALKIDVYIPVHALFTVLSLATSLSSVGFSAIVGELPNAVLNAEPTNHPSLQSLSLRGEGRYSIDVECPRLTELLACFNIPSLTTLFLFNDGYWDPHNFKRFLDNSSCRIKHLCLDFDDRKHDERLQSLHLLPWLETLELRVCKDADEFDEIYSPTDLINKLRQWDSEKEQFCIAPLLKEIIIDFPLIWGSETTIFADMVEDRWRRSTQVDFVRVVVDQAEDNEDCILESFPELIRLFVLKKEGLDVTVTPPHWLEKHICR